MSVPMVTVLILLVGGSAIRQDEGPQKPGDSRADRPVLPGCEEESLITTCVEARRSFYAPRCDGGDLNACVAAGSAYASDIVDFGAAILAYGRACEGGIAEGCHGVGGIYGSPVIDRFYNPELARPFLERARELYAARCRVEEARACASLVDMLENGQVREATRGERKRLAKKTHMLLLAQCRQGLASACGDLADFCVRQGREDDKCFLFGLQSACKLGDSKACWVMGWTYRRGARGVRSDAATASEYFARACEGGYRPACGL